MKKIERILAKINVEVIFAGLVLLGVIWITPILFEELSITQELQRTGTPSSEQNVLTLFLMVCVSTLAGALCCCIKSIAWRIFCRMSWKLKRDRHKCQECLEPERQKRVLRKVLFEEIKDGITLPEEDDLWKTLSEMTVEELQAAREQRRELLEEMEEKGIVADVEVK